GAGDHPGDAEPLVHCRRRVLRRPLPAAGAGARLGGVRRRLPAARAAAAVPLEDRHAAALAPGPEASRGAAGAEADGTRGIRRLGGPDFPVDQHYFRLLPGDRQRVLAGLRRPADGIPGRRAGRGAGNHPAAEPFQAPCERCVRGIQPPSRLGPAPDPDARAARRRRACSACAAPDRDAVPLRAFQRDGCLDDPRGAARLQPRAGRLDPGEDSRAGFLRAAERGDAGEDRPGDARRHAGDELRLRRPAQACGPRACHRPGRLPECDAVVRISQETADLFAAAGLARIRAQSECVRAGDGRGTLAGDGVGGAMAGGGLALEDRDDRRPGAARHRGLRPLPLCAGLSPARFRHAGGSLTAGLDQFAALLARDDGGIELARACLQIAEDAYPGLDVDGYLGEIERFAKRLGARLAPDAAVEDRVIALNEFLFADLGFNGNARDYYDPRNSYLNEVIDRRRGIPITLSVLYIEIGRRIGLPLDGVSFPGHFMVRLPLRGGALVLDPFSGGTPQSEDELRARLKRVIPGDASVGVPVADLPLAQFLEPASNPQILARLLRNLKGVYREKDKPERLLEVLNRMLIVAPEAAAERRD